MTHTDTIQQKRLNCNVFPQLFYQILYLIFDYPHKHYTFKYFEV